MGLEVAKPILEISKSIGCRSSYRVGAWDHFIIIYICLPGKDNKTKFERLLGSILLFTKYGSAMHVFIVHKPFFYYQFYIAKSKKTNIFDGNVLLCDTFFKVFLSK